MEYVLVMLRALEEQYRIEGRDYLADELRGTIVAIQSA